MFIRFGLLTKNPNLSREEFTQHWKETHGNIVKDSVKGLREYSQNHITDDKQLGIDVKRGNWAFDGFSQLAFDSQEAMIEAMGGSTGETLESDESHFLKEVAILGATRHTVIEPPTTGVFIKRMSILTRPKGVSPETYRHEWLVNHPPLVSQIPGVIGYRQNIVEYRENPKGTEAGWEDLRIDGMVELWFRDPDVINEGFRSEKGLVTMKHSESFLEEISTYLVDEIKIL